MGLDKNSIDALPSTVNKNILVFGYSSTRVHGTKKKFSRTLSSAKKKIRFCLQYYCMGLGKKINRHSTSIKKKIVSDYSTTWCKRQKYFKYDNFIGNFLH